MLRFKRLTHYFSLRRLISIFLPNKCLLSRWTFTCAPKLAIWLFLATRPRCCHVALVCLDFRSCGVPFDEVMHSTRHICSAIPSGASCDLQILWCDLWLFFQRTHAVASGLLCQIMRFLPCIYGFPCGFTCGFSCEFPASWGPWPRAAQLCNPGGVDLHRFHDDIELLGRPTTTTESCPHCHIWDECRSGCVRPRL